MKILDIQKQNNELKIQYIGRFSFDKVENCVIEHFNTDIFEILDKSIIFDTDKPVFITIKSEKNENKEWFCK